MNDNTGPFTGAEDYTTKFIEGSDGVETYLDFAWTNGDPIEAQKCLADPSSCRVRTVLFGLGSDGYAIRVIKIGNKDGSVVWMQLKGNKVLYRDNTESILQIGMKYTPDISIVKTQANMDLLLARNNPVLEKLLEEMIATGNAPSGLNGMTGWEVE